MGSSRRHQEVRASRQAVGEPRWLEEGRAQPGGQQLAEGHDPRLQAAAGLAQQRGGQGEARELLEIGPEQRLGIDPERRAQLQMPRPDRLQRLLVLAPAPRAPAGPPAALVTRDSAEQTTSGRSPSAIRSSARDGDGRASARASRRWCRRT